MAVCISQVDFCIKNVPWSLKVIFFFLGGPQEKYFNPKPRIPGFPTKDVLGMVVNPLDALTKNGGRVLLHHALLQSHGVFLLFDWRVLGSRTVCLFLCCT